MKPIKKVTFTEDTIDNEHMNKRKSKSKKFYYKVCCIFKKRKMDPDDTSSESCSSCDEKGKNGYERPNHYDKKKSKI